MFINNLSPVNADTLEHPVRNGERLHLTILLTVSAYASRRRNHLTLCDISYGFYLASQALFLEIASLQPAHRQ